MHHFTIVFYTFTLVVVMVLYSGYLLVVREISAEGLNSPSSKRITVWDVSNLVETRIELSIIFFVLGVVFGLTMYNACNT